MEASNLPEIEFKITVKRCSTNLWGEWMSNENLDSIKRDIETIKKNQIEMRNTITEMKNTLQRFNSTLDKAEDQISELEDKVEKYTKSEQQREKEFKKMRIV